jgi:type IV pilus assembly protein PilB
MATPNPTIQLGGLARKLVHDGHLPENKALEAQNKSVQQQIPFVNYVVSNKLVDGRKVAISASEEFGVPVLDVDTLDIEPDTVKLVSEKLIRKHKTLPIFKRGNRLYVAVSDPTNLAGLDEIKFHAGMATEPVLVEEHKLERVINKALEMSDTALADMAGDADLDDVEFTDEDSAAGPDVSESDIDDTPVVRFVNKVLLDAINKGASDIHFEPYEKSYRVRLRMDGMLTQGHVPTGHLGTTCSPGRTDQAEPVQEPGHRFSCQHLPDPVRRENRAAYPGPDLGPDGY